MIHALDPERGIDFSLRLARRPEAGKAEVWLHLAAPGLDARSLADPTCRLRGPAITAVTAMEVSDGPADGDPGDEDRQRRVRVTCADGTVIDGRAKRLQRWSVPIEGVRRPGASSVLETGSARLHGSLDDWRPPARGLQAPGAVSGS